MGGERRTRGGGRGERRDERGRTRKERVGKGGGVKMSGNSIAPWLLGG